MFKSFGRVKWAVLCFICVFTISVVALLAYSAMSKSSQVAAKSSSNSALKVVSNTTSSKQQVEPLSTSGAVKQISVTIPPEMRAVWITTDSNTDFPSKNNLSIDTQKAEIDKIINNISAMSMNTIILQVKAGSGVLYKSQYFPWSEVLTGNQGQDPGYDPLAYFITQAHQKKLQIQAWVNPYQIQAKADTAKLSANNPAILHPSWTVKGSDGGLYFDPGIPDVSKLVENSIKEIVQNYNIDGILLDKFYPSSDFNDNNTYLKYGKLMSLEDFRRNNTDNLIQALHTDIKAINPSIPLGVSPFGVWANKAQYPPGSDTTASIQTYYDQFADTRLWVQHSWIDYVCPQIYWSLGFPSTSFENVTNWWVNTVKGTNVALYISHAVYKTNTSEQGWNSPDQIVKQLQNAKKNAEYKGSAFYGYKQLVANTSGVTDSIKKYLVNQLDPTFGKELSITTPQNNLVTNESQVKISGSSDSNFPLYINNKPINRILNGAFAANMNLTAGKNTFTITHKGKSQVINVTYSLEILKSINPISDVLETGGTTINISAYAQKDATINAKINGITIKMVPTTFTGNDNSDTPQLITDFSYFGCSYKLPAAKGTVQNLGKISVTAAYKGFTKTMTGGSVNVQKNSVSYVSSRKAVTIKYIGTPSVETYLFNDDMYRPVTYPQLPNSWDYIETNTDGVPHKYTYGSGSNYHEYYKLSNGEMVYTSDVTILPNIPATNNIGSVTNSQSGDTRYTHFEFGFSQKVTYSASTNINFAGSNSYGKRDYNVSSFNADTFQITFYNTSSSPNVGAIDSPLISSVDCNKINSTTVQYVFHLKHTSAFYGSYISYDSNGKLIIDLKNPWNGDMSKLRVAIDPGHGGSDPGASLNPVSGPFEKTITLDYAKKVRDKLISMGVKNENIYLARSDDTDVDKMSRTYSMVDFRPDFSLCIHQNAYNTTSSGVESYYFQPFSQLLVTSIQKRLVQAYKDGGDYTTSTDRGAKFCSSVAYYSCRQIEIPSTLVECGFIDNANEYNFISSDKGSGLLTSALANGVLDFMNTQKQYCPNAVSSSSSVASILNSSNQSSILANSLNQSSTKSSSLPLLSQIFFGVFPFIKF
jgi:uncharacterized lipoprotein YddW (UPF0748 family)/N-acetylmuramoyl-L-alanine amidase